MQLPFYMTLINCTWIGLWAGLTFTTVILVVLEYGMDAYSDHHAVEADLYRHNMTMVSAGGGGVDHWLPWGFIFVFGLCSRHVVDCVSNQRWPLAVALWVGMPLYCEQTCLRGLPPCAVGGPPPWQD
jgi:hypothetical protein